MWLHYYLLGGNPDGSSTKAWDKVFELLIYNPYKLAQALEPGTQRKIAIIWDDTQATAPAEQGVPRSIRRLANFLSTERPEIACVILTAPNINSISSPLRKLVNFEIIVSERGQYEVHKITYHKYFKKPLQDWAHLDYIEELDPDKPFPPLPHEQQIRYDKWRIEQKLTLYPNLMADLDSYMKFRDFSQTTQLDGNDLQALLSVKGSVVKAAGGYVLRIPDDLGKKYHKQLIEVRIDPQTK